MDSRAAILKGTDDGPVIVPGKPEESEFIKSLKHIGDSKMPEKADKLPDAQIEAMSRNLDPDSSDCSAGEERQGGNSLGWRTGEEALVVSAHQ